MGDDACWALSDTDTGGTRPSHSGARSLQLRLQLRPPPHTPLHPHAHTLTHTMPGDMPSTERPGLGETDGRRRVVRSTLLVLILRTFNHYPI
jgi:hypothetical protein